MDTAVLILTPNQKHVAEVQGKDAKEIKAALIAEGKGSKDGFYGEIVGFRVILQQLLELNYGEMQIIPPSPDYTGGTIILIKRD